MDEEAINTLNDDDPPGRKELMETAATDDISSDEDDSFRTCEYGTTENSHNLPVDHNVDSDTSDDGDSDMFLTDDTDIGGPSRERDTEDDIHVETSFQRDLLDYLGSLFNTTSRIRPTENRQPLTINNEQLSEYKDLRDKVDAEMKILGVKSMTNSSSSDQSIASNLYLLLASRERGDWGSCRRYTRVVPMWTFETKMEYCDYRLVVSRGSNGAAVDACDGPVDVDVDLVTDNAGGAASTCDMMIDERLDRGAQLWCHDDLIEYEDISSNAALAREEYTPSTVGNDKLRVSKETKKKRNIRKYADDGDVSETVLQREYLDCRKYSSDKRVLDRCVNVSKSGKFHMNVASEMAGVSTVLSPVWKSSSLGGIKAAIYGSRWSVRRLGLETRFPVHEGCVNALHFSGSGGWIASGSDDRKVVITDWQRAKQVSRFAVGHSSNIFQVRFMPGSGDLELVTCSRDKSVRYAAMSSTGQLQYSRVLHKHADCCHKLDMPLDQPSLVMSAGEDGKVLWSDVRTAKSSGRICSVDKVPLYSISCNPVRSQEFCVAGKDDHVYVFDRRKPCNWTHQLSAEKLANRARGAYHVTSVVYSGDGNSVLASYNDEDIYLFSARPGHGPQTQHKYVGHRNVQTVTGVAFYGPNQEYVVSGSNDGHVLIWERETEALVHWFLADEAGVVNVLEAHPTMPVLATSGLDHDVKLWSMLAADGVSPRVIPGDEDLLLRDQETSRIDLAWSTLSQSSGKVEDTSPILPFSLRNLQLVTALNWKMRSDSHPYSFDSTLENLIFMSRRHGNNQLSNLLSSDSEESTETAFIATNEVAADVDTTGGGSGSGSGSAPPRDQTLGGPDGCRSS